MMKLVLVRHGITVAMTKNIVAGITDTPLAEEGIKQLKEYKENFTYPKTNFYYSSPLLRARQTLEILFPEKKLIATLEEFKEHNWGGYEYQPREVCNKVYKNWLSDQAKNGEENYSDFQNRVIGGIRKLYQQYPNDSVTVVCHAGVIKTTFSYFLNYDSFTYTAYDIKPGYAYAFDISMQADDLILKDYQTLNNVSVFLKK